MPPKVEEPTLASLRKPMKVDGVITYFLTRRLSLAITRRIMNTRITPNQVTLVTLLLGISSGLVVATGGYWAGVIGALLLQTQAVLDCVDGELARLRSQKSRLGQWLDTISDDVAKLSFLTGAVAVTTSPTVRWIGGLGIASFVITEAILYYILATRYRSGDLMEFQWDVGGSSPLWSRIKYLFMYDFFCLLCLVLSLLGRLDILVSIISIGTMTVLITLLRQLVRHGMAPLRPTLERQPL